MFDVGSFLACPVAVIINVFEPLCSFLSFSPSSKTQ